MREVRTEKLNTVKKVGGLWKLGAGNATLGLGSSALILAVTTAIALVAIATTAWLASNRDVDSGSMAMDVDTEQFELSVETTMTPVDGASVEVRSNGVDQLALAALESAYSTAAFKTSSDCVGIVCGLQINGAEFRPGMGGTLTFRLHPAEDDQTYVADLKLSALTVKTVKTENGAAVYDENGQPVYEIEILDPSSASGEQLAALELLKGHILFFNGSKVERQTQNGKTIYSYAYVDNTTVDNTTTYTHIAPGKSAFQITDAASKDTVYTYALSWEWPITYDRLTEIMTEANGFSDMESTDPIFLYGYTSGDDDAKSAAYDNGDQIIGTHIAYVLAEITVNTAANEALTAPIVTASSSAPAAQNNG